MSAFLEENENEESSDKAEGSSRTFTAED